MKKIVIIPLFFLLACDANFFQKLDLKLKFTNNSNTSVYFLLNFKTGEDTLSIISDLYPVELLPNHTYKLFPGDCRTDCRWDSFYNYECGTDTAYFCIIDANKLKEIYGESYNIYTVNMDTAIIQRYDLTYTDLLDLNAELSFPPDERMKDIKMFPQYKEKQ